MDWSFFKWGPHPFLLVFTKILNRTQLPDTYFKSIVFVTAFTKHNPILAEIKHAMITNVTLKYFSSIKNTLPLFRIRAPFYGQELTLIPAWIRDYIHFTVWDAITYPFLNLNGAAVDVWEWISNFTHTLLVAVITSPCWEKRSENLKHRIFQKNSVNNINFRMIKRWLNPGLLI